MSGHWAEAAMNQQNITPPFHARHVEISAISSADDDHARPSERLLAVGIDAAEHARKVSLDELSARMPFPPYYPNIWPGEHYKLLAGITLTLQPRVIVEIGTGTGLSALPFQKFIPQGGRVFTFDVIPWKKQRENYLRDEDFLTGDLVQYTDDLSNPLLIPNYLSVLAQADLIFLDAAKDGETEIRLLQNLATIPFQKSPIVVLDDIKLWNMLKIWREIRRPKLDLTSFGHWSGTGLVDWAPK